MKTKYGFKTFITTTNPLSRPKKPFDITKDLTQSTAGLWVYLTPTRRLVTAKNTGITANVVFTCYENLISDRDHVYIYAEGRFVTVPTFYLHTADEPRPDRLAA